MLGIRFYGWKTPRFTRTAVALSDGGSGGCVVNIYGKNISLLHVTGLMPFGQVVNVTVEIEQAQRLWPNSEAVMPPCRNRIRYGQKSMNSIVTELASGKRSMIAFEIDYGSLVRSMSI